MAESEKTSKCPTCPVLGTTLLENNLQSICYPNIKRRNRPEHQKSEQKNCPRQEKFKYYLGNDFYTNDPDEAMQEFMKRDFAQVPKHHQEPHLPIFVPECYSHGQTAIKVIIQKEGRAGLDKEKEEQLSKHEEDLQGKVVEEDLHNKLRYVLELEDLNITNTVMISGWEVLGGKNVTSREFDFFIVSEKLKTFIHIEAKQTLTSKSRTSALNQLKNGFELINSSIPFPSGNGWHYVKAIYFHQDVTTDTSSYCDQCQSFLLGKDRDLSDWLKSFLPNTEDLSKQNSSPYFDIVKYLFHQKFQQGEAITKTDYLLESKEITESLSTMKNIFFWSNVQFNVLQDAPKNKRMVFASTFGTGKTLLLQEKAKILLKAGKDVIIIIFQDPDIGGKSILFDLYQQHFEKFDGAKVEILQMSSRGASVSEKVEKIITENKNANFFMDEVFVREDGVSTSNLNEFSKVLSEESFLWVACQSEHPVPENYLEGYTVPKLNRPLRYSANILKVTKTIGENEGDTCFPPRNIDPSVYLNRGQRAIFFALKKNTNLACAIDQLLDLIENLRVKTLIKIDFERDFIVPELRKSSINQRLIFTETSESLSCFLDPSNNEAVLVVSSRDNSLIRGIEVPVVVHFTNVIGGDHVQAIYTRCQSKLIIICNEEHATKVVPSDVESDAAKLIHVYDKLMPKTFEKHLLAREDKEVFNYLKDPRRPLPVDSRNKASETSLTIACKIGAHAIVERLLDLGADLDAVDKLGWKPIHYACKEGNLISLKKIIQNSNELINGQHVII